jgi:hypothetical protein
MAAKIILTLEVDISEQEQKDLEYLISDALAEFATRRYPAKDYVDERYPKTNEGYNWVDRTEKVAQVERRIDLARKLHNAALHPEVFRPVVKHINHAMCETKCIDSDICCGKEGA